MARARVEIHSFAYPKERLNLSPWVMSVQMSKSMHNGSLGTWSAVVVLQPGDKSALHVRGWMQGFIRDDDWAYLDVDGVKMVGLVTDIQESEAVDQGNGASHRVWTLQGTDWSRCMTTTQIRMKSLFATRVKVEVVDYEKFIDLPSWMGGGLGYVDGEPAVTTAPAIVYPERIPGFIDERDWQQVLTAIFGSPLNPVGELVIAPGPAGSPGTVRIGVEPTAPINNSALQPLLQLLDLVLEGLWVDPAGVMLLSKLVTNDGVWPYAREVRGYAWQLPYIIGQSVICPDQILRQYLCESFVEIFYDYAPDKDGKPTERPAVFIRPKSAVLQDDGRFASSVPVTDLRDQGAVMRSSLTRSGQERFNFWMPNSPLTKAPGVDRLIDVAPKKRMPILDATSVTRHGVKPAEPADSHFPPMQRMSIDNEAMLEWHRDRLCRFYGWYNHNPEYLTGTVAVKRGWPTARLGTRLIFSKSTMFQDGNRLKEVDAVEAYIVGWSVDYSVSQSNGAEQVTQNFIIQRGQPVGGLSATPIPTWSVSEVILEEDL